jgi:regulatory subunit for Cdc7p protein kinase
VDQFFSAKVTHLVVKGAGTPQKPRIPTKRDSVRDSPSNPFRDSTHSTTDLASKAEKMGMKVWTLKSRFSSLKPGRD